MDTTSKNAANPIQNLSSLSKKFPLLILILIGVFAASYFFNPQSEEKQSETTIKSDAYYAVFLTNGQVYFGKLASVSKPYMVLSDIYYLRVGGPLQAGIQEEETSENVEQNAPEQTGQEISLIKLGAELHGPTDQMNINREHILFYEELKSDSKVVTAIKNHKNPPSDNTNQNTNPKNSNQ